MTDFAVVATHGFCFDGATSAALFTQLLGHFQRKSQAIAYRACVYSPHAPKTSELLVGELNALLDFQFVPDARLNWYFDHHTTSFATQTDREYFEARQGNQFHQDPTYGSCTRLIHDFMQDHAPSSIGANAQELVTWAERIDTANYESPDDAINRAHPVMQLMTVIENQGDDEFLQGLVPALVTRDLGEVAESPLVRRAWEPLREIRDRLRDEVHQRIELRDEVAFVELTHEIQLAAVKFIPYALFRQCLYSVVLSLEVDRLRISVGYNRWSGRTLRHNIGRLCQRYGGGGHAVVGGIALPPSEIERARQIAAEVISILNQDAMG